MPAPAKRFFRLELEDLDPVAAGEWAPLPELPCEDMVLLCHQRKGHGTLTRRGIDHRVGPGQGFVILPGEDARYTTEEDPVQLAWIGFKGRLALRFSELSTVFSLPKNALPSLRDLANAPSSAGYLLAGDLFCVYAQLLEPRYQERDELELIVEHIEKNYMQKLTVENFALRFNTDRRYLSQQFKARYGTSIRNYLTKTRVDNAKVLLSKGRSTAETAALCGFVDASNFHKMFTAYCGMTPNEWKKMQNK